jgi:hypothetical protein
MSALLFVVLFVFGWFMVRMFADQKSFFGLIFVVYFVWHQFTPALAGGRTFWSTTGALGFNIDAALYAIYFFVSGIVVISLLERKRSTAAVSVKMFTWRDYAIWAVASLLLAYYILSNGITAYLFDYDINCGNCIEAASLNTLFLRSLPRYLIWFYLVLWATNSNVSPTGRALRFLVAFAVGLIVFPPLGSTRYQYLGFAMSLVLLSLTPSRKTFGAIFCAYPIALYFPVGAISFLRAGQQLPDRLSDFVNSPDFSDFETLRIALLYGSENSGFNGIITLSSLFPLPRQLFPEKWEGTGFTLFSERYITFPNVGFSPFAELILDFGIFAIFLWPMLILGLAKMFQGPTKAFIGLLPIMLRGSLLAFAAPILIMYFLKFMILMQRVRIRRR